MELNYDEWVEFFHNYRTTTPDPNVDYKSIKRLRTSYSYWIQLWYRKRNLCLKSLTHLEIVCFCDFEWRDHNVFPVLTSLILLPKADGNPEYHNLKMTQVLVHYNRQRLEAYMWLQYCIKEKYGKILLDKRLIRHVCEYLLFSHCVKKWDDDYEYYNSPPPKTIPSSKRIKK